MIKCLLGKNEEDFMKLHLFLMLSLSYSLVAKEITLLYSNDFPWTVKGDSGVDILLMKEVDKNLTDVTIKFEEVPWKRCLDLMAANKSNGCFTASFKAARQEMGVYPGGEGVANPDDSKRIHSASYTLYRLKGSGISNNGMKISGHEDKFIGGNRGYSIIDDLAKEGLKMDQRSKNTKEMFDKLLSGEYVGVVALTLDAEFVIKNNADIAAKVEKAGEPLVNKPYFVMFSKDFYKNDKALAEKIWAEIGKVRDSQAHQDAASNWLANQ